MIEIPEFLKHLPEFSGFPVPYVVFWNDDKPDFRINDQAKQIECYKHKLCAICGKRMFEFWFIGGPKSIESGMFTDGPMHLACAVFASHTCPFLTGKRVTASAKPTPVPVDSSAKVICNEEVPKDRPDKMAMRQALTFVLGQMPGQHLVYQVTKWKGEPVWF